MEIVRITPEERTAIDQIARLAYRLERVAANAAETLGRVHHERRRALERLQAQIGPAYEVDDDGNQTLITSGVRLPGVQEAEFEQRLEEVFGAQRPKVRAVVDQLGEEMAVLRMMDPILGTFANRIVLSAQLVLDVFHSDEVLLQAVGQLQTGVRLLHEAARERY